MGGPGPWRARQDQWFAGVDWGSEKHHVCLLDVAGAIVGERAFAHDGAGLVAMCDWLMSVADHLSMVAVAIEVPHGPVVDALLDRGFAVHAINPKQLDRLRDRFSMAGAKDDRRDVRVAAAGLRSDPHLFRPLRAGDPGMIELREWSPLAEELQQERVRLANTEFCQAERKPGELCATLNQHAANVPAFPCDAEILRSLPGVGTVVLATLLTEAGDPLARRDCGALRTLSSAAPVTKRSGKAHIVVMRYAAHVRLRQAVFHWARVAILHDPKSRRRYETLRQRGHSSGRIDHGHPLVRLQRPSLRPDRPATQRRAQARSRRPSAAPAQGAGAQRPGGASTALCSSVGKPATRKVA